MSILAAKKGAAPELDARLVVRQPIFHRADLEVFGYEMAVSRHAAGEEIEHCVEVGWAALEDQTVPIPDLLSLSAGKPVLLPITGRLMMEQAYKLLPAESTILELVGPCPASEDLIAACKTLKNEQYRLALDHALLGQGWQPHSAMADIISFTPATAEQNKGSFANGRYANIPAETLIRELDTRNQYDSAVLLNFSHYQGGFIAEPNNSRFAEIPAAKQNKLLLLKEINRTEMDPDELERVIKRDISLATRLLRLINSAATGVRQDVSSLKQAIVLLGERGLKRWATISLMKSLSVDTPSELMRMGLMRGRCCEQLAGACGLAERQLDLFMFGMLSVLDAMLNCPMAELVEGLPVPDDIKAALLGDDSEMSGLLKFLTAYGNGEFETIAQLKADLPCSMIHVPPAYEEAVQWADECMG